MAICLMTWDFLDAGSSRGMQAWVELTLDGLAHTLPIAALSPGGIGLSRTSAASLRVTSTARESVTLQLRGRALSMRVAAVLGPETFGALAQAHVAVMPLERLQQLAGLRGRVSRILVQAQPGRVGSVSSELRRLAAGKLAVAAGRPRCQPAASGTTPPQRPGQWLLRRNQRAPRILVRVQRDAAHGA